jgi:hypothetical protein
MNDDRAAIIRRILAKVDRSQSHEGTKSLFLLLWCCGAVTGYAIGSVYIGWILTSRYQAREKQYQAVIDKLKAPKNNQFKIQYL